MGRLEEGKEMGGLLDRKEVEQRKDERMDWGAVENQRIKGR
jgi:hypothetical protein